jgi:prephenate dehydratase
MFYADIEGHPDDPNARAGARGTRLLLRRAEDPRHLSGANPFREKIREPEANRALRPTPAAE